MLGMFASFTGFRSAVVIMMLSVFYTIFKSLPIVVIMILTMVIDPGYM